MRQSKAAFALIVREHEGELQLLAQWNASWNAFNFVGGKQEEDEDFLACACRELEEELELGKDDYTAPKEPCAVLDYVAQSGSKHQKTTYHIGVFKFDLTPAAHERISADKQNTWLSYEEIFNCRSVADRRVSETMGRVLQELVDKQRLPVRRSAASFALITREHQGGLQFLARWNEKWNAFNFVGGKTTTSESAAQRICRKLKLNNEDHVPTPAGAGVKPLELDERSASAQVKTHYSFAVLPFALTESGGKRVSEDAQNAWLTFTEIVNGVTADKRKVSNTMRKVLIHVLTTSSVLPRWRPECFPKIYDDARLRWKQLWIRAYRKDEVIAQAGDHSEWAMYLLHGHVAVYKDKPTLIDAPARRRLDVPDFDEYGLDVPVTRGRLAAAAGPSWTIETTRSPSDRLMGVASTLWNQRRSTTLIAAEDCEILYIKRMVLLDLVKNDKAFEPWRLDRFWAKLPHLLRENQLVAGDSGAAAELAEVLRSATVVYHRYDRRGQTLQRFERQPQSAPVEQADQEWLIFKEGDTAPENPPALYFILHGAVRLTRTTAGHRAFAHQYTDGGFFGHACLDEHEASPFTAEAVADTTLLQLSADGVRKLIERAPTIKVRLTARRALQKTRLEEVEAGLHFPPDGMTDEMAKKLLLARDILRIDTDLCTRCDECVVGCVHAHDDVARFQRANPKLNFDHWEIALACVHCTDAPCQTACQPNAISLLPSGLVHIHQDRCTGCRDCLPACPFDVIVMRPTALSLLARTDDRLTKESKASKEHGVATKCDRCMSLKEEPMCVTSCPYDALERDTPMNLFPRLRIWAEGKDTQ